MDCLLLYISWALPPKVMQRIASKFNGYIADVANKADGPHHGLSIKKIGQVMHQKQFRSVIRDGYELYLVVEIPYDQQQNYLSDSQQFDLPF